ncbi:hypothetical protein K438DRAFT_1972154 [Mycena galopus ATCC 62051]|nr:hypothetical protein K438DRAFT_1972154 [Mycena galopus ATCC 62051]
MRIFESFDPLCHPKLTRRLGDLFTEEGFQFFQEGWYIKVQSFKKALEPDDNVQMLKERFMRVLLNFEIPTKSNIVRAAPVVRSNKFGRDVPFAVSYVEICRMMGLDSQAARLGYKWENERTNAPNRRLANADDWEECLENGITARARLRHVACVVKNLDFPQETVPVSAEPIDARKRKRSSNEERKTFDFTKEYDRLKAHLTCAEHKHCCYVKFDSDHQEVNNYRLRLWAKEMVRSSYIPASSRTN